MFVFVFLMLLGFSLKGQISSVVIPSNISTGSLEKNLLFYADKRYEVTRQGPSINVASLFDGLFTSQSTSTAPTIANPLIILIENLPAVHTQNGAWVGWSTRNWKSTRFKIEGYNVAGGANQWVELANVNNNSAPHFMTAMPSGSFTKLRYVFYEASGAEGRLQLSELFYIHPEAVDAYEGMMVKYNASGNVGIGTATPMERLSVNGNIRAKEVKVETANWPDYVFEESYPLLSLKDLEAHIKEKGHLPGIPTAGDVEAEGVALAEMNRKLLEKVEELTLYILEQQREIIQLKEKTKNIHETHSTVDNCYLVAGAWFRLLPGPQYPYRIGLAGFRRDD